jgi:hypothetical protein
MAHECEDCGMECYCDMDDCGGLEQPNDCPHFTRKGYCSASEIYDEDDFWDDGAEPH